MASADPPTELFGHAREGGKCVDVLAAEPGPCRTTLLVCSSLMDLGIFRSTALFLGASCSWLQRGVVLQLGAGLFGRCVSCSSDGCVFIGLGGGGSCVCVLSVPLRQGLSALPSPGESAGWGFIAFLLRYGEDRRDADLVFAALSLAAFLWTGWYSAVFALVAECCVGHAHEAAPMGLGVLVQGGLRAFWFSRACCVSGPSVLSRRTLGGSACTDGWAMGGLARLPRSGLICSTWSFRVSSVEVSKSVYLGLVVMLLALAAGRRAVLLLHPWSAPFVLLSLGPTLMVAGDQMWMGSSVPLPAQGLRVLFPPLEGLTHWWRSGRLCCSWRWRRPWGPRRLARRWTLLGSSSRCWCCWTRWR